MTDYEKAFLETRRVEEAKQILEDAGYFGNLNFHKDDILDKLEKMGHEFISDQQIDEIIFKANNIIENNESIWDAYWFSIEEAISDTLKTE